MLHIQFWPISIYVSVFILLNIPIVCELLLLISLWFLLVWNAWIIWNVTFFAFSPFAVQTLRIYQILYQPYRGFRYMWQQFSKIECVRWWESNRQFVCTDLMAWFIGSLFCVYVLCVPSERIDLLNCLLS